MVLLSIIVALLIDRIKPADSARWFDRPVCAFAQRLETWFNAGEYPRGLTVWLLGILPAVLLALLLWYLCFLVSPILGWLFNVALLYVCVGFSARTLPVKEIAAALNDDDIGKARSVLSSWTGKNAEECSTDQIVERTVEATLKGAFSFVFAPIFWFCLLPGPVGLLLYRLFWLSRQRWRDRLSTSGRGGFARWVNRAAALLDWPPKVSLAAAFALVGNFEDVLFCCRTQSKRTDAEPLSLVLSAGAAAIGLVLRTKGSDGESIEYGVKDAPDPTHVPAVAALCWRSLFAWFLVIGVIGAIF